VTGCAGSGVDGVEEPPPPAPEPPFWVTAVHFAYKVIEVITPGVYGKVIADPPSIADQPANVNPERVGADGSETVPPVGNELGDTAEPLLESNVTT
jgi:hypothetical protein